MIDTEEFISLIRENEGIIFKVSSVYTNSYHDQQDLYQDIVAQLWTAYRRFKGMSKVSTWVYRVSLNTAITSLRKKKRRVDAIPIEKVIYERSDSIDTDFEDRINQLYQMIGSLSDVEKGLVLLYLEDLSGAEISEITGFSETNVRTRLSRIKQRLRERINQNRNLT